MQVTNTAFTIAEYCGQFKTGSIIVNRQYQRTDAVWPPAARSYLIDTILHGFPIPKIILFEKTDLRSRKTVKEIVDGQQRTRAIFDFFSSNLRITGHSKFYGKTFEQLNPRDQQAFLAYSLSTDVFTAVTEDEIRQMFRRINSYTIPLNPEEQRHATHQGAFKWLVVETTEKFASILKEIGVFEERALSRMQDAKLFTELAVAVYEGIQTYSKVKLDRFYENNDPKFPYAKDFKSKLDVAFHHVLDWEDIHNGVLMKPFVFYALLLSVMHCTKPIASLQSAFRCQAGLAPKDTILANLGILASVAETDRPHKEFVEFWNACEKATNTKVNREARFLFFCRALKGS